MKKSIVLTLIIALVLAMTSSVFAAEVATKPVDVSLQGVPTTAKVGDEFTVTVHFSEGVETSFFTLRYSGAVLKYVAESADDLQSTGDGYVTLGWLGKSKTDTTLKFQVIGEGEATVSYENTQPLAQGELELVPNELPVEKVTVAKADEGTGSGTEQGGSQGGSGTEQGGSETEKGEESGKPTQYAKTGVNYVVAGGVLLSLISLVAVAKKM